MKRMMAFFLVLLCCSISYAENFDRLVFFGDSLSDNGNLYEVMSKLGSSIPPSPYFKGRFSNGPTWAEDLGERFAKDFGSSYKIYAYGGSTAASLNSFNTIAPTLMSEQLDAYLQDESLLDHSKTLYLIWIGANDYLFEPNGNIEALTNASVAYIAQAVNTLSIIGGRHFLILDLPDLSKTPFAKEKNIGPQLYAFTQAHNQRLATVVNELKLAHPESSIVLFHVSDSFKTLVDTPEVYNQKYKITIRNTTDACWTGNVLDDQQPSDSSKNPEEYLFWDDVHPTAVIHQLLAQIVGDEIAKEWG